MTNLFSHNAIKDNMMHRFVFRTEATIFKFMHISFLKIVLVVHKLVLLQKLLSCFLPM